MGTTTNCIEALLRETSLNYARSDYDNYFVLPYDELSVFVHLLENGEALELRVPGIYYLVPGPRREDAFAWMLKESYKRKIGRWCCNDQGQVMLDHFIPIEDGDITARQLLRVIVTLAFEARRGVAELARITQDAQSDEHRDSESPALSDLPELLERLSRDLPDVEAPDPPVDEATWLRAVVDAAKRYLATRSFDKLRAKLAEFRQVREASVAAGHPYVTKQSREEWGLDDASENLLFMMLAQHSVGDDQTLRSEATGLEGVEQAGSGVPNSLQTLLDRGLAGPSSFGTFSTSYCLSTLALERLEPLLGEPNAEFPHPDDHWLWGPPDDFDDEHFDLDDLIR